MPVQIKYIKVAIFQRFKFIISQTYSPQSERTFDLKDFYRMLETAIERCSPKRDALTNF